MMYYTSLSQVPGWPTASNHDSLSSCCPSGEVLSQLRVWPNGTWRQDLPWGGYARALASASSPLLEVSLPTQASLLPAIHRYEVALAPGPPNTLTISYGVGDRRRQERVVETVLLVSMDLKLLNIMRYGIRFLNTV